MIKKRFMEVGEDVVEIRNNKYLPSFRTCLLLYRLVKRWSIDIIVGVGRFESLEAQMVSHLVLKKPALSYLNFSRSFHWTIHPKWHLPKVGYITVNAPYYKDHFVRNYQWPPDKIAVLEARYELPESIKFRPVNSGKRVEVLIVRRLDSPKFKAVLNSIDHLDAWDIWDEWSIKIIGSGTHESYVRRKVDEILTEYPNADITLLGQREDVGFLMSKAIIVIGSERVAVEGVSRGCLVLLTSDDGFIDVITPENIEKYSYDNFCGHNYTRIDHSKIKDKLFHLLSNKNKTDKIIDENFKFVKKHFNVDLGLEVLHNLIKHSLKYKLNLWDKFNSFYRILKSWLGIYVYLCKDRMFRLI